jgi:hypothetical protein
MKNYFPNLHRLPDEDKERLIKQSEPDSVICPNCSCQFEAIPESYQHLIKKLLGYCLDRTAVTSDNIGNIRYDLFLPFDCAWNGNVREMTAERENLPVVLFNSLRDQLRVQGENGNWNYDSYMHGMYNGLECALATLEHREPQFRSAPTEWLKDRPPIGFISTLANEESNIKTFICPFKIGDKIFNNYDGVTAHVTELTDRGFKYKLTEPKTLVARWNWVQEGGEAFLDLSWAPSYWELYTGENKIKPFEMNYEQNRQTKSI